jgi:hypothetical protein
MTAENKPQLQPKLFETNDQGNLTFVAGKSVEQKPANPNLPPSSAAGIFTEAKIKELFEKDPNEPWWKR